MNTDTSRYTSVKCEVVTVVNHTDECLPPFGIMQHSRQLLTIHKNTLPPAAVKSQYLLIS